LFVKPKVKDLKNSYSLQFLDVIWCMKPFAFILTVFNIELEFISSGSNKLLKEAKGVPK